MHGKGRRHGSATSRVVTSMYLNLEEDIQFYENWNIFLWRKPVAALKIETKNSVTSFNLNRGSVELTDEEMIEDIRKLDYITFREVNFEDSDALMLTEPMLSAPFRRQV
ncbi:MAG: hypothetical protein EZS28_043334, partial [Streblomastix strix]